MEISARRGIRIGLKRYALVVNSGVRVSCLEIWFQNRSVAPVSRFLPHRTRRTGGGRPILHPQRKALTGQNKRTLCRPADSGSQRPIHPALRRETESGDQPPLC